MVGANFMKNKCINIKFDKYAVATLSEVVSKECGCEGNENPIARKFCEIKDQAESNFFPRFFNDFSELLSSKSVLPKENCPLSLVSSFTENAKLRLTLKQAENLIVQFKKVAEKKSSEINKLNDEIRLHEMKIQKLYQRIKALETINRKSIVKFYDSTVKYETDSASDSAEEH